MANHQEDFKGHEAAEEACLHSHAVGRYMVRAVPMARDQETAGAVRARLAGQKYDDASHVFVLADDGTLTGIVSLTSLIGAEANTSIGQLMVTPTGHTVNADTDREDAASLAIHMEIGALAVTAHDGWFLGAIPATALMSILRDEHLEDLHHMAGILGRSEAARAALTAPPLRRALFRLPWLLIGLVGSGLFTAIMAHFEASLSGHVAVAFFVPALIYLADSVGTQSETVVIKTLSLSRAPLTSILAAESATGLIVGFVLSTLALPLVWLSFGDPRLALAVGTALFFAIAVATGLGALLPWLFDRFGFDPALSSGPIATVFQDSSTLIIYLTTAAALVSG